MDKDISAMSISDLRNLAKSYGIETSGVTRRSLEGAIQAHQDCIEPVYNFENMLEKISALEKKVELLDKRLTDDKTRQKKLRLRQIKFSDKENMGTVVINALDRSLDTLEKYGYAPLIVLPLGTADHPGDSVPDFYEHVNNYRTELDTELTEIEASIEEFYAFKMPPEMFEEVIPLEDFIALVKLSEKTSAIENTCSLVSGPGNSIILTLGENTLILDHTKSKKVGLPMNNYIVRCSYYNGTWLIGADRM
jgi:hypothetical protein